MTTISSGRTLLGLLAAAGLAAPAAAGGLERGGYNIDLLFEPSPYALESSATFVAPQRRIRDAVDNPVRGGPLGPTGWPTSANEGENYWVPRIGAKAAFGSNVDCMVDYSQPWGVYIKPGLWQGAGYNIETKVESDNYAATCRVKFDAGRGDFSIIGGVFYQEVEGYKYRQVATPLITAPLSGVGRLDMEGDGWGWRAGVAYEIPEIAFRTSLVYNSAVDVDLTGSVDLTQVPSALHPLGGAVHAVYGKVSMPDSLELKVQSGIAPDWLAFASVKWTDWSQIQVMPFCLTAVSDCRPNTAVNTLDLFFRDGWTISGGIGHKFNDKWSGAASVTWDRGTSTVIGPLSDVWTLGLAAIYSPTPNVEWRLAGAVGVLTSGESGPGAVCDTGGTICGNEATYRFGNDVVAGISTSIKLKF